jgi:hypothetical protein
MILKELSKQQVWDLPLAEIQACNKCWEDAVKEHDPKWLMTTLKNPKLDIKKFILGSKDYQLLHYQFKWCELTGQERMIEKFKERTYEKTKSHGYYDGGDDSDQEFLDMYYGD